MNKSQFACQQTLLRFRDSFMWTFTFRDVLPINEAISRWHNLQKDLVRYLDFEGVRVFELHPGGHGVHVHLVTPHRYSVDRVRELSEKNGFGRIHVETTDNPDYVAKYVTKSGRGCWPKGTRLWATFGKLERTRVRDVQVESLGASIYHNLHPWFLIPQQMERAFMLFCFGAAEGRYVLRTRLLDPGVELLVYSVSTGKLEATYTSHSWVWLPAKMTWRRLIRRPWDWWGGSL